MSSVITLGRDYAVQHYDTDATTGVDLKVTQPIKAFTIHNTSSGPIRLTRLSTAGLKYFTIWPRQSQSFNIDLGRRGMGVEYTFGHLKTVAGTASNIEVVVAYE